MKNIMWLVQICTLMLSGLWPSFALKAQTLPAVTEPTNSGGVYSRNMELVSITAFRPHSGDQFTIVDVKYDNGNKTRRLLVTSEFDSSPKAIRLIDITDPYNVSKTVAYATIKFKDNTDPTPQGIDAGRVVVYTDVNTPGSSNLNGDVFLLVGFDDGIIVDRTPDPKIEAHFLVIDLSKLVAIREAGTATDFEVSDAGVREVYYGGVAQNNKDVYIGYLKLDRENGSDWQFPHPHTVSFDQKTGLLALPPGGPTLQTLNCCGTRDKFSFVDTYDMKTIVTHCVKGSATLGVVPRFTMNSMATGMPVNIPLITQGASSSVVEPHDIVQEYISSTKTRFYIGSTTQRKKIEDHTGGVVIVTLDHSTPTDVTVTIDDAWDYHADRQTPNKRHNGAVNDWTYRQTHTAAPFFHTDDETVYVLTADEFKTTRYSLDMLQPDNSISIQSNGAYAGGVEEIQFNLPVTSPTVPIEDDRRLGSFTRIWDTDLVNNKREVVGTGTHNGPLSLHDPQESEDDDILYYSSTNEVPTTSIEVDCNANNNTDIGINTVHRVHTISKDNAEMFDVNDNDVFVSDYAAGARVINLTNTGSTGKVIEKGFFDFIPRLNYDKSSIYFYKLGTGFMQTWDFTYVADKILPYFLGAYHIEPDFGENRVSANGTGTMHDDVKFLYVLSYGEGWINEPVSGQPQYYTPDPVSIRSNAGRNWVRRGGFMGIRYFDGKIGGTITGYTGTNSFSDKSYRTVNLQGDFDVERDVVIANGTTVNILPGHSSDPGIFTSTSFVAPGTQKIIVHGVLNVSVPQGDAQGTDIVFNVPIEVSETGCLIVHKINSNAKVVFKKSVTVKPSGIWTMKEGSNVELDAESHFCNGKFTIKGTQSEPVTFTGRRAATGIVARGSFVSGVGKVVIAQPWRFDPFGQAVTSHFEITYGNCTNTYFDFTRFQTPQGLFEIANSTFKKTTNYGNRNSIVRITNPWSYPSAANTNPPSYIHNFEISNSTFESELASDYNPDQNTFGVYVNNASKVCLLGSEFKGFKVGANLLLNRNNYVSECDFINNELGLHIFNTTGKVCSSTFDKNNKSVQSYQVGTIEYYDNTFDNCVVGVGAYTGGTHWLRNNSFDEYARGLSAQASELYLRDRIVATRVTKEEFGRNDFLTPNATYTGWSRSLPVHDVQVYDNSTLNVECGYNDFQDNSTYHVKSDNTCPAFNSDYNNWVDGMNFQPVVNNINFYGTEHDDDQDPTAQCGPVSTTSSCGTIQCVSQYVDYNSLSEATPALYTAIDSIHLKVLDTSYTDICRRSLMWEYLEAVSHTDSVALFRSLTSQMKVIEADTNNSTMIRSTALAVTGRTHMFMSELDSATFAFDTLVVRYTTSIDSVTSHWNLLFIEALSDTNGDFDSLFNVYIDEILSDISESAANGGLEKSSMNPMRRSKQGDLDSPELQIAIDSENPASEEFIVGITTFEPIGCELTLVSIEGEQLVSQSHALRKGYNSLRLNVRDYSGGRYLVVVKTATSVLSLPVSITR